jgi:hypothetical protein
LLFQFVIEPSYKNWAPYVGKAGNNDVVNTEFMKVSSTAKGKPEDLDEIELTEDLLIELMSEKKVHFFTWKLTS